MSLLRIFRLSRLSDAVISLSRISSSQLIRGYSYRAGGYEKDKGFSLGDYPALPWRSAQELPAQGWWDDQDRRNKGDPLHEQDDILNMWVCDYVENNGRYTRWEALGQLAAMFSLLGFVYGLSKLYESYSRKPCVPRQFPYNNLYLSRGGDPNAAPTEKSLHAPIKSTYGEIFS